MSGNNHLIVDENDVWTLDVYFRNQAGTLTTPVTTTYAQRKPTQTEGTGTTTTSGWTTAGVGHLTRPITFDTPGLWYLEARGAGNSVDDVQTWTIDVRRSNVRV